MNDPSELEYLVSKLKQGLFKTALVNALKPVFGGVKAQIIGTIFKFLVKNSSYVEKQIVKDAYNLGKGILQISYTTSYHGSWYYHSCLDVWRTSPTVKEPSNYYGIGHYTPN